MQLESLTLTNFRCFGPDPETVTFGPELTTFIGTNGSGKTAVMLALLRMFGVSGDQRRVRRQDFHVPAAEEETPAERHLALEAIFAFPELAEDDADQDAVPEFFQQMAADEAGVLKCRLRLEATWTNDGSVESLLGEYQHLEEGMQGPAGDVDAPKAVLGKNGKPEAYADDLADHFSWYRYLFLGRGKPTTHVRVLSRIDNKVLAKDAPEVLQALLNHVAEAIQGPLA